jgi:hypothetical protein
LGIRAKKENKILYGTRWRIARIEMDIWLSHATSSAHILLYEKSEAGKQLRMNDF